MTETQAPPQPVRGGAVPYLMVDGAFKAAEFYQRAFGAEQVFAYPPDEKGRTMHIHLYVNGSSVMLSDAYPEHGAVLETPQGFNIALMIDDIDARYQRAIDAGATPVLPPPPSSVGEAGVSLTAGLSFTNR